MALKAESLTIFPAAILYFVAIFLSVLTIAGPHSLVLKQQFWNWAFTAFAAGFSLTCCWFISSRLYKKFAEAA